MKHSTAERMRLWRGPPLFSFGFRPFFLLSSLWAVLAMALWIALLSGTISVPTRFDPVTWHIHEFLFGYISAVIAGFLLTAVPNWTGRLPIMGLPLAGLTVLWLTGRMAVMMSAYMPVWAVILADLAFLMTLWAVVLRELVAGKNWRNLPVLALAGVLILANLTFHLGAASNTPETQAIGLRLALSVVLVLISMIGGKIIPSFTRNWLVKQGSSKRPTPPMQRFDKVTLLATIAVLVEWTVVPFHPLTAVGLTAIAVLHLLRLLRWQGLLTLSEPLVWVLHVAYALIPLGALLTAVSIQAPHIISSTAAVHVWTSGAIGLMTIAVMTRATLGHSGHALRAGPATVCIYVALIASVVFRVLADYSSDFRMMFLDTSAIFWVLCFAGFAVVYGRMLVLPKTKPSA